MTLRSLALYSGLGCLTDILIVLYYKTIQGGLILPAVVLSTLITAVPFFVVDKGINARDKRMFVAYAIGAGAGTAIGMIVHIQ